MTYDNWKATDPADRMFDDCEKNCTCRMPSVNSASVDPTEPIVDPWCPVHGGRDPD